MPYSNLNGRSGATIIDIAQTPSISDDQQHVEQQPLRRERPTASPKVEEIRNMIRHILHKLGKRKRPPPAMLRLGEHARSIIISDQFENEDTLDLLIQLRTALILCHQTGLGQQILMQHGRSPSHSPTSSRPSSPTRSSNAGVPTPLFDSAAPKKDNRNEFERILLLLDDLVLNDCLYKTANPKPSRPPYTMQSVVLDIATLLTRFRDDAAALYSLGATMLPAFQSFNEEVLAAKLLSFHLDILFPKLIRCNEIAAGDIRPALPQQQHTFELDEADSKKSSRHQHTNSATPKINIQTPVEETDLTGSGHVARSSHLTIDTRLSVTQPSTPKRLSLVNRSPTSPNSTTHQHPTESQHAFALFTPLLFFMIQYLNPYLAPYRTGIQEDLTFTMLCQTYSISNFHRALQFMIQQKPDLYIDLLDVISHSIPEVKYRACQILFHYYRDSLGHISIAESFPKLGLQDEVEVLERNRRRQEYEAERQRERDQTNSTSHESMIGNSTSFNLVGINRRYRNGIQASPSHQRQPSVTESQDEDFVDIHHIWYPHMFTKLSESQSEDPESSQSSAPATGGSSSPLTVVYEDINSSVCRECLKPIKGYGLRCYQCKTNSHYNCFTYQLAKESMDIMLYVKKGNIQKVVTPQFCPIPPSPRSVDNPRNGNTDHGQHHMASIVYGHQFELVNLYTLMLCAVCHLPLWGVSHQGYRCITCNRFIHPTCLATLQEEEKSDGLPPSIHSCSAYQPLLESDTKITESQLSESLRSFYCDLMPLSKEDLSERSYEEVGTILNVLLLQENILHYGITTGCLLTDHETDDPLTGPQENEALLSQSLPILKEAIGFCVSHLNSGVCRGSSFLNEFYNNQQQKLEKCVLSKEDYLSHLAAMMKSMVSARNELMARTVIQTAHSTKRWSAGDTRGYLKVVPNPFTEHWDDGELEEEEHIPKDMMAKETMLSWVMQNLNMKSRKTSEIFLQHMQNLGLFERRDAVPILFNEEDVNQARVSPLKAEEPAQCIFPVPFAIDCSPNVESLINAIEACLSDIDITVNECGMTLLVRRCWPDSFTSRYTTERLVHAIVSWIFQEDEKLSTLLAEYATNKKKLPGVRQNLLAQASPSAYSAKIKATDRNRLSTSLNAAAGLSSGAGIAYVTARTALRDRYITKWLAAIHDMDDNAYGSMLFDNIERIIEGRREESFIPGWTGKQDAERVIIQTYEEFMGHILKLKSCGLTFSVFDVLLQKWLDKAYMDFNAEGLLQRKEPADLRNLARLCSPKSSMRSASADPVRLLDIISNLFLSKSLEEVQRGVRWLSLMMHAGTGVPSSFLAKLARLLVASKASIETIADFTKLIWYQAVNVLNVVTAHTAIVDIIGYLNESVLESLPLDDQDQVLSANQITGMQRFIKYSAVLACFAYNCPLSNITELDIVPYFGDHVAQLSHGKRSSLQAENIPMTVHEDTPIIRCMLTYLKMEQLNSKPDVIKMFYALIHWGFGISNKSDFSTKSTPLLIPAYKALDNMYGLFTKMDAAFQTKWLPMLSNLGPVFSYFVECLWDKEEYVRSKAFSLIRTFGTLHLRSAFRCWEAYFLTANEKQKKSLVNMMIQLNALFPDWQVLQWESLLDALETKHRDKSDLNSVDILERYMRPSVDGPSAAENEIEPAEIKSTDDGNNHLLMLMLALQMLSNHLSVDSVQMSRIKYALVEQMGFEDCRRYNSSDEWIVEFGTLLYNPADSARTGVLLSCSRMIKSIMDSFAPLPAETVAAMAPDTLGSNKLKLAENSSPGVHFIDVALKLFNSDIDVTKISHIMLQTWLEIILIVVYKHNILDREHETNIVTCIKQIIELLIKDISEENKLLILEILKCLLRRSDHLTAMVLSKQIMALGKLITKSGSKVTEPVFLKAKQFLKSAFLRFAVAGLFVLMFKNQVAADINSNKDMDLFFLLRTVIDPTDIVLEEDAREVSYLRDQPVRDVLDKLMQQQMDRKAFSTVLQNMSRYVESVHSHPYSETILHDYNIFLGDLVKHTADWRRSDWNINSMFTMSAIIMKEHPYYFSTLLPEVQALLKHGIQNCTLQPESIVQLMASYSAVAAMSGVKSGNAFADSIIDDIRAGVNNRQKLHKDTLLTLLQLVLWDSRPSYDDWYKSIESVFLGSVYQRASYFRGKLATLLEPLVNYLRTAPTAHPFTKKDFKTYNTVSLLVVGICQESEQYMNRALALQKLEETRHCLRFLSWFSLGVLKEGADDLLKSLIEFEDVVTDLVTQTLNSAQISFDSPDLNFSYSPSGEALLLCFFTFKCRVLLNAWFEVREISENNQQSSSPSKMVFWLSVWPPLKRLLESIDTTTLFMTGNVGLSVWNMFLSLLQFLFVSRCHIIMVNAHEWSTLLDNLLHQMSAASEDLSPETSGMDEFTPVGEFRSQVQKVRRMFDMAPVQVPVPRLIDQLYLELRDIMRLQAEGLVFQNNARIPTMTITNVM
ncbi:hypothetical protein EC973_001180 [Apophysomyces ossiformis]|uniref:Phorbol-ester/DAG-type domain-containing protein n=1 Tax=Apophysomyces ossiformis TaxID=679940 RepID=A0A8H7EMK4_9FUNG|nr:hypothetical protein EC973_001180 [Apophysomyces ossiformis]